MDPLTLALLMGGGSALKWLMGSRANNQATDRQYAALGQAQGAIQGAADKAMGYQQPYLQNAGADFNQFRNLVQSGFFQQPYGKSFQSQSFQGPSFAFNPSQGKASFASWQPQGGPAGFNPMPLPGMPQPPPQAAPQPSQMSRPNAMPQELSEWRIAAGAEQAKNFPQNLPGGFNPLIPTPINPYTAGTGRGEELPYSTKNLGNLPVTTADLLRIMRQGGLPRGPGGSGPFIPQYGRA